MLLTALILVPLRTKLLELAALFLIWSPGTPHTAHAPAISRFSCKLAVLFSPFLVRYLRQLRYLDNAGPGTLGSINFL